MRSLTKQSRNKTRNKSRKSFNASQMRKQNREVVLSRENKQGTRWELRIPVWIPVGLMGLATLSMGTVNSELFNNIKAMLLNILSRN